MTRWAAVPVAVFALTLFAASPVQAQEDCGAAVVVALPGVTWSDVERVQPPHILAAAEEGAVGSIAVRTVSSRTTYASGFATIGAGTRLDGSRTSGAEIGGPPGEETAFSQNVTASGLEEIRELAEEAGYNARPGALAETLDRELDDFYPFAIGNSDPGLDPPAPLGYGRWSLLAAMDADGVVEFAATAPLMLEEVDGYPFGVRTSPETASQAISSALSASGCRLVVVDPGDLTRADELATTQGAALPEWHDRALLAADALVGAARASLSEDDLLLIVSPTSPGWDEETHLGVAIATGRGFTAGSTLTSGSTRAPDLVTLPDVAPTVLEYFGVASPPEVLGRGFVAEPTDHDDRIAAMVDLNDESVYSHGIQADLTTGYVLYQLLVLALVVILLRRERGRPGYLAEHPFVRRCLEWGALSMVAFPLAAYLSSPLPAHELKLWVVPVLIAVDLLAVAIVSWLVAEPLDRLMVLALATVAVMVIDLVLGGRLLFNALFGNDPIVAGRFAGLGNIAFAILGGSTIVAAALLVHRWSDRAWIIPAVVLLFAITVIADGAPQLGSDVGGVLALVPAMAVTLLLLTGRRPSLRMVAVSVVGGIVVLAVFLAIDLARPFDEQTHLGRFYTDVRDRGATVFIDTIERKGRANLRVFTSTIWTFLVPPALGVIVYLLRRPHGSWGRLAAEYPKLRAGLIGALVLGVLGFAVNDSGIVVPAMILSFLVPLALLTHLEMGRET